MTLNPIFYLNYINQNHIFIFILNKSNWIKDGLENNNWLYGFHFEGNNNFIVDPLG